MIALRLQRELEARYALLAEDKKTAQEEERARRVEEAKKRVLARKLKEHEEKNAPSGSVSPRRDGEKSKRDLELEALRTKEREEERKREEELEKQRLEEEERLAVLKKQEEELNRKEAERKARLEEEERKREEKEKAKKEAVRLFNFVNSSLICFRTNFDRNSRRKELKRKWSAKQRRNSGWKSSKKRNKSRTCVSRP